MSTHHHHKHGAPGHSPLTASTGPAAISHDDKTHNAKVTAEEIRLRAYRKWENAGRPSGDGIQFWLEAEQELARGK